MPSKFNSMLDYLPCGRFSSKKDAFKIQFIVFRPIFSLKPEFYKDEKEISFSFQKCIGLYTFYAVVLRNLTSN